MLSLIPDDLMREIRAAEDWLKPFHTKTAEMIVRYAGKHYRSDVTSTPVEHMPENYAFAWHDFVKPQLVFGRPQAKVEATRSVDDVATAEALTLALNDWSKETSWKATLTEVVDDCFFGFGVTKVGIESRGDYDGGGLTAVQGDFEQSPQYPFCVRVDPRNFIIDARGAKRISKARLIGHSFERDVEDSRKDQRYDQTIRKTLQTGERESKPTEPFPLPGDGKDAARQRITLYELYVPEHGLIITLADSGGEGGPQILRKERYFGPDEGPYTMWGLNSVPGELMPISPLRALWDQILELNEHRRATADSAATHKRIGLYDASNKDDADRVQNAKNGEIVGVTSVASVKDFEIGGASEYQLRHNGWLREGVDRNLGFTDSQRGQTDGDVTATDSRIANGNSSLRVDGMRDRLCDCVINVYEKLLWYFFNAESIGPMDLIHEDPRTGARRQATFVPGNPAGVFVRNTFIEAPPQTSDVTDFNVSVDSRTMQRQDDAILQKRAQDMIQLVVTVAPQIQGMPWVNWKQLLNEYGKAYNDPTFADRVLNLAALQNAGVVWPDPTQGGGPRGAMGQQRPGMPMQQSPAIGVGAGGATMPGLMNGAMAGVT